MVLVLSCPADAAGTPAGAGSVAGILPWPAPVLLLAVADSAHSFVHKPLSLPLLAAVPLSPDLSCD